MLIKLLNQIVSQLKLLGLSTFQGDQLIIETRRRMGFNENPKMTAAEWDDYTNWLSANRREVFDYLDAKRPTIFQALQEQVELEHITEKPDCVDDETWVSVLDRIEAAAVA